MDDTVDVTTTPRRPTGTYRRPDLPDRLRKFVEALYDHQCIRCKVDRPLECAHINNLPEVRAYVAAVTASPDTPMVLQPEDANWLFHQGLNVVLLCPNCHTLYDQPKYADVTAGDIVRLRDCALRTERAAVLLRDYMCRMFQGKESGRGPNRDQLLAPFQDLLQTLCAEGILPPPHQMRIDHDWMVDLAGGEISHDPDSDLPMWTPITINGESSAVDG